MAKKKIITAICRVCGDGKKVGKTSRHWTKSYSDFMWKHFRDCGKEKMFFSELIEWVEV